MTDSTRAEFEAWISAPPFEREVERFGDGSAWPGNYRELDVDLAWCAWSASRAAPKADPVAPNVREAAQAVLDRWDSPQWQWAKQGPTADLIAALRAALAAPAELVPSAAVLLAEQVLHMDMVTERGIRARDLARQVLYTAHDVHEGECAAVLRELASYLSAGGYNAPAVDPKVFREKIMWGIAQLRAATAPAAMVALTEQQFCASLPAEVARSFTPTELDLFERGFRHAEKVLGRAAPAERGVRWLPIETAPKDGTEIDLWTAQGRYAGGRWKRDCWRYWGPDEFDSMTWARVIPQATHWMPTPDAPGITGGTEEPKQ